MKIKPIILGIALALRRAWCKRVWRLLHCLPGIWPLLWRLRRRSLLWLPRFSDNRRWRPAILCSWPRILVRRRVLRLEARSLGEAARSASLDSRPLRRARILSRVLFSEAAAVSGLPNRDQSTRQTEGRSHEHFQKIVASQIEARPEDEQGQRECNRAGDRIDHKQNDCAVESKKRM